MEYKISYDKDIIQPVTDQEVIDRINNILDKTLEDYQEDFEIRIKEYEDFNVIYFVNELEKIINIPEGVTCETKIQRSKKNSYSLDEFKECFIIIHGNDYDIYQNDKLIYGVYCEKSYEITNEISGEKYKLLF
jgi:hypothetical protein